MNFFKIVILFLFIGVSFNSNALDLLELKTRTNYPKTMETVQDAVSHILEPIEYKLVLVSKFTPDAYQISVLPIKPIARTNRTMSIYDAIQSLIGVENTIVVDHVNKKVSFLKGVHTNETVINERGNNEIN